MNKQEVGASLCRSGKPAFAFLKRAALSLRLVAGVGLALGKIQFAAYVFLAASGARADVQFAGVNLAGAEFGEGHLPGVCNTDYTYPNQSEVDYFKRRGLNIIRLPFRWERLQVSTNANLNSAELNRLTTFVSQATAKGMRVILDPHNYGRYYNQTIGSPAVPYSAFSNFWWRVAAIYKTNDLVIFGLMNEPHDMSPNIRYSTETWRDAAQAAIYATRAAGATNLVLVPGNGWTGAHSWLQSYYGTPNGTAMRTLVDPADNYAFEVHQYLDSDSSGGSEVIASPTIGAQRLAAFTQWCRANHRRGFLGEFAVASSSIGAGIGDEAVSNMLAYMRTNSDVWLGWTWWAAGPWWGDFRYTLEPTGNFAVDRPAMGILRQYLPLPTPALQFKGGARFTFATWPGFRYQPEQCTALAGNGWIEYGPERAGDGRNAELTIPSGDAAGFLRVRVRLGP